MLTAMKRNIAYFIAAALIVHFEWKLGKIAFGQIQGGRPSTSQVFASGG
jgi:hypothetical protein